jgi:hypothetical protein
MVVGRFDLIRILMLLYSSVVDGAVAGLDFPVFS